MLETKGWGREGDSQLLSQRNIFIPRNYMEEKSLNASPAGHKACSYCILYVYPSIEKINKNVD